MLCSNLKISNIYHLCLSGLSPDAYRHAHLLAPVIYCISVNCYCICMAQRLDVLFIKSDKTTHFGILPVVLHMYVYLTPKGTMGIHWYDCLSSYVRSYISS